jgi:hypothetical protein
VECGKVANLFRGRWFLLCRELVGKDSPHP